MELALDIELGLRVVSVHSKGEDNNIYLSSNGDSVIHGCDVRKYL